VAEVTATAAPPADEVVDMDTTPDISSSLPALQALPTESLTDDQKEEKEISSTEPAVIAGPPVLVVSTIEETSTEEDKEAVMSDDEKVVVEEPASSDAGSSSEPVKNPGVAEDETKVGPIEEEVLLV